MKEKVETIFFGYNFLSFFFSRSSYLPGYGRKAKELLTVVGWIVVIELTGKSLMNVHERLDRKARKEEEQRLLVGCPGREWLREG